jgi:hypothetical protein
VGTEGDGEARTQERDPDADQPEAGFAERSRRACQHDAVGPYLLPLLQDGIGTHEYGSPVLRAACRHCTLCCRCDRKRHAWINSVLMLRGQTPGESDERTQPNEPYPHSAMVSPGRFLVSQSDSRGADTDGIVSVSLGLTEESLGAGQ